MRRTPFDKNNNARRNIASGAPQGFGFGFGCAGGKDAGYRCSVSYNSVQESNYLQRSVSADDVVIRSRGFKPSDRHDPVKRNFLENLTSKILHFDMESGETTPVNLQKLLTPASDSHELLHSRNKKMFASSYFYAPTHPTVEDQVELARRISHSLSDVKNMKSKGQSMYVNRKKRSVKWIHDGNGIEDEEEPSTPVHKEKMPLRCLMNPCGKVLDIHGIQALGEEVNIQPMPKHPEKLFDIVRDLNNQRGRGAEIFAKRRKRSEKWVVDRDPPQTPCTPGGPRTPMYPGKTETNGGPKLSSLPSIGALAPLTPISSVEKPFYNPFTVDLSLDGNVVATGGNYPCRGRLDCVHTTEVKKIYLREVAVGTDGADFPSSDGIAPSVDVPTRVCLGSNDPRLASSANASRSNANTARRANGGKPPGKSNACNSRIPVAKDARNGGAWQDVLDYNHKDDACQRQLRRQLQLQREHREGRAKRPDGEDAEYTPVPVKQLIQEFEKTCRPVLQYKQISPKVIPIVQRCPLDSDIARYFENRNPVKCEEEREYTREARQEYEDPGKSHRSNGYASTDDTEYTTDDTDEPDDPDEPDDYRDEEIAYRQRRTSASLLNGEREFASVYRDEYSRALDHRRRGSAASQEPADSQGRRSIASQELEALYRNGDAKFVNSDSEVPVEAKSLLLSMVASQGDILETIKHLRGTPVLDNLLPGASPDCNFADVYPDVGKLYENGKAGEESVYKGPKLSSIQNLTNYNTAPRGWNQSLTYYRPIKFEKQQDTIVYSDF